MKVFVSDPDSSYLTVRFYDADSGSLIDSVENVLNGSYVTCTWPGLSIHTTYHWQVEISDGDHSTAGPIWSFTTGEGLWSDEKFISASTGGTITLTLDAGPSNAGRNYVILGSVSGTSPGTPLPGGLTTLPLNWDSFTNIVWSNINTPMFANFMGTLDGNGQATAQLNIEPVSSEYIGTKIYFAYCLNNPFDYVSNPIEIEIIK